MRAAYRYFPGLNTLRLYAALSVVLGHAVQINLVSQQTGWVLNFFIMSGYDAVTLFFVLSGFLITYLLLDERSRTGTISVKQFLLRRFLRIQPVYFVVIILSVILFPHLVPTDALSWGTLLLWSPHIGAAFRNLNILGHYWSIGVEEWYYFGLPFLFKWLGVIRLVVLVLVIRLVLGAVFFPNALFAGGRYGTDLERLFVMLRFECMAVGGFFAWLYFYRHRWLKLVYLLEAFALAVFLLVILLPLEGGLIFDFLLSIVFAVVILCVATKPKPLLKIENPLFRRLGDMTYGVYMYQGLTLYTAALFVTQAEASPLRDVAILGFVVVATLAVAWVSWNFFEAPIKALGTRRTPALVNSGHGD